ncbi:Ankyrin repeat-containing protein [Artemisia annua]|uniref:Ankyrin repeat-containing protein n=1 Tax=Artemisia annua TaxID=35608 RepID=A0A2U1PAJ5_ARTAN|nr:Ankyrin repeat-containing protein [Artemisia annua]
MAESSKAVADVARIKREYNQALNANVSNFVTVKLSGYENYDFWHAQMMVLLEVYNMSGLLKDDDDVWHSIEGSEIWNRYDKLLKGWVLGSIDQEILPDHANSICGTALGLYEDLQGLYDSDKRRPIEEGMDDRMLMDVSPNDKESTEFMKELLNATMEGSWWKAKAILKNHENAATMVINNNDDTMLHLAVREGKNYFVNQLLNFIKDGSEIAIRNSQGHTALHTAATVDNKQAAKLLVNKSNELLNVKTRVGNFVPLDLAYFFGHIKTFLYLLEVARDMPGLFPSGIRYRFLGVHGLLANATSTKQYNLALKLVEIPELLALATKDDNALFALTTNFPPELGFWEALIYPFPVAVFSLIHLLICIIIFVLLLPLSMLYPHLWKGLVYAGLPIKHIEKRKRDYGEAIEVLKRICKEMNKKVTAENFEKLYAQPILEAARVDACEVVVEILSGFVDTQECRDERGHNVIQLATLNRSEKIYNRLSPGIKHSVSLRNMSDDSGNKLTHFAAKLASSIVLSRTTGAALQLQRELQWYEEVKKLMLPLELTHKNRDMETSEMVFTREHADLLKEGEESCSITAALIVTIVFAAAITVPGGSNQETGIPLFKKDIAFTIFAVCDALSLFTAATALLVFLSILTTRFAAKDFMVSLPRRLILGLCALFISTTAMMVAFGAILFLVFCDQRPWMLAPIGLLACLPILVIVTLQLPLVLDLYQSTYISSIQNIGNGTFVFKFKDEQGLQDVVENGVWIVNSKPMVVQKWDISVDVNKVEPSILPVWIKMLNIPLEAWSVKGLSALASSLGKPIIMDAMTTRMCTQGVGRLGYARVLVEVDAKKGLKDSIDIQYCDKSNKTIATKTVKVEYDWKPPICSRCQVFGHSNDKCGLNNSVEGNKMDVGYSENNDNGVKQQAQNKKDNVEELI